MWVHEAAHKFYALNCVHEDSMVITWLTFVLTQWHLTEFVDENSIHWRDNSVQQNVLLST